jgi:hypothetical protein
LPRYNHAAHLARTHPDARVLLTTFSDALANALQTKLNRLLGNEPRLAERMDVHSINAIGLRLYRGRVGQATFASREMIRQLMKEAASSVSGHKFGLHFLLTEWEEVVDAWQLENWEGYRDVVRLGRKTRLPEAQRHGCLRSNLSTISETACNRAAFRPGLFRHGHTVRTANLAAGARIRLRDIPYRIDISRTFP